MPADWHTAVTQLRGGLDQGRFMTMLGICGSDGPCLGVRSQDVVC